MKNYIIIDRRTGKQISERRLRKAFKDQAKFKKSIDDAIARVKNSPYHILTTLDKIPGMGFENRKVDNHVRKEKIIMKFILRSSSGSILSKYKEMLKENGFELGEFIEESVDINKSGNYDYDLVTRRKYITVNLNDMNDVKTFIDLIDIKNDFDVRGFIMYREDLGIERYYVIEIYDGYRE